MSLKSWIPINITTLNLYIYNIFVMTAVVFAFE
jgi:hypothetical protein